MPYISENAQIIVARENTRGTKAALGVNSPEQARVIGITDRRVQHPDYDVEVKRYKTHGNFRQFLRQVAARIDFGPNPLPFVPLDGFSFYLIFGREYTTGSSPTGSATLNGAHAAGVTTINSTAHGLVANDFAEIGNAEVNLGGRPISEVWKVVSATANSFVIASPGLIYSHATGAAIKKVVAPFTHNFEPQAGARKPTFTWQSLMNKDDDESPRFLRTFLGSNVHSADITGEDPSGDGGDLRIESQVAALDITDDTTVPTTFPTATFASVDPFMFYQTAGVITVAGRTFGTIESIHFSYDDKPKKKNYFGASSGRKPAAYLNHFPEYTFRMQMVPDGFLSLHTNSIWDLLRGLTKADVIVPFLRDGAVSFAASSDALQFQFLQSFIKAAPHEFPDEGEVSVACEILPTTILVQVKDSVPMYAAL